MELKCFILDRVQFSRLWLCFASFACSCQKHALQIPRRIWMTASNFHTHVLKHIYTYCWCKQITVTAHPLVRVYVQIKDPFGQGPWPLSQYQSRFFGPCCLIQKWDDNPSEFCLDLELILIFNVSEFVLCSLYLVSLTTGCDDWL